MKQPPFLRIIILGCALGLQPSCSESDSQTEAATGESDSSVPMGDGAAGQPGDPVPSPDASLGDSAPATDASTGPADASTGPTDASTDAAASTAISKPGEYSGYSPVLYEDYQLTSQYVPVRDGTRLAMDIFRPMQSEEEGGEVVDTPLPVVWMHTPYNRRYFQYPALPEDALTAEWYPGQALQLVKYGYVVAVVDFRGLYASYGRNGAYNRGEWLDEARWDAYDITEWLAEQPWCDGNVGMWGCSATGGSQMQAATTAPPHLRAIFPMSCEFDVYPFGVPGGMAPPEGTPTRTPTGETTPEERDALAVAVDADSDGSMLAEAVAEHQDNIENAGYVPYRDSTSEALGEQWWIKSSPHTYLDEINQSDIAIYVAANWDEGATKYGAFFTFNNVTNPAKLIVGPGGHCAWLTVRSQFGFDIVVEEHRFFDHWLKGIDNGIDEEPPVYYYTYNAPEGEEWRSADGWPPANATPTAYYLGSESLSTDPPAADDGSDEFTVDYEATSEDGGVVGLVYATEPLSTDVEVTGHPVASLWVSSTANDGDFIATLQDVAPDGTVVSRNVNGRLRASHRKLQDPPYDNLGLPWHRSHEEDAEPLSPGEPAQLTFDLYPISYIFKAGHRIQLTLSFADSVATPRFDPAARVTVYRNSEHSSSITLPIMAP